MLYYFAYIYSIILYRKKSEKNLEKNLENRKVCVTLQKHFNIWIMAKAKKVSGYVIYEGASRINGKNIVAKPNTKCDAELKLSVNKLRAPFM